ncbi:MAG TPA: hypothetical protein VE397_10300, partial [Stellaceae bacterium]|nr:hypothetical protein [Stellaceae bacterium]
MWLHGVRRLLWAMPYAPMGYWSSLAGFIIGCSLGWPLLGLLLILYLAVAFAVAADGSPGRSSRLVHMCAAGGQLTYSSYMLHEPLMAIIVDAGEHVFHLQGALKNALVALAFLAVWPVSYMSLLLLERPLRRKIAALGAPAEKAASLPSARPFATIPAPEIAADQLSCMTTTPPPRVPSGAVTPISSTSSSA